jgi:hypothetical protein
MRKAANLLRERANAVAPLMTMEQASRWPRRRERYWRAPM